MNCLCYSTLNVTFTDNVQTFVLYFNSYPLTQISAKIMVNFYLSGFI